MAASASSLPSTQSGSASGASMETTGTHRLSATAAAVWATWTSFGVQAASTTRAASARVFILESLALALLHALAEELVERGLFDHGRTRRRRRGLGRSGRL